MSTTGLMTKERATIMIMIMTGNSKNNNDRKE